MWSGAIAGKDPALRQQIAWQRCGDRVKQQHPLAECFKQFVEMEGLQTDVGEVYLEAGS